MILLPKAKSLCKAVVLSLLALPLWSQSVIGGRVEVEGDPDADGVTVVAMSPRDSTVLAFAMTGSDGHYELRLQSSLPQLLLAAYRMDTERQVRLVENSSRQENFRLRPRATNLREVLVTAPTVYRQGDTLSYVVSKLTGDHDEVIADVLARVPGMRVKKGGMLEYLGKSITTVMIEGVDLTQGGYGLITENVKPRDISAIEILQSFEKIRALQDKQHSEEVAVNLKLSGHAKGVWSSAVDLAGGYGKGLRSQDKLTAHHFTKKRQHLLLGYFDNTGHPDADPLVFGTRQSDVAYPIVSGTYSPPGDLPEESYLDNTTAYLSQSSAIIPRDSVELKIRSHYTYNLLRKRSDRVTSYVDPPLVLSEITQLRERRHEAMVAGDYELNKHSTYLSDHLELSLIDLYEPGSIVAADEQTTERVSRFRVGAVSNRLRLVRSQVRLPYELRLDLGYRQSQDKYEAIPSAAEPIAQRLERQQLSGYLGFALVDIKPADHWRYRPELSIDYRLDRFREPLLLDLPTTEISLGQRLEYKGRKLFARLSLPVGYLGQRGSGRWFVLPSGYMEWKPNYQWTIDGGSTYSHRPSRSEYLFPGTLYMDYRTIRDTKEVSPYVDHTLSSHMRVTYSDVFRLLSIFVRGRQATVWSDYLDDVRVTDQATLIRPCLAPHRWSDLGADLQISKGFGWKSLAAILDLSLDRMRTEVMSRGERMPYDSRLMQANLRVSMAPAKGLTLEYGVSPQLSQTDYGESSAFRSLRLRQQLKVGWTIVSGLYLSAEGQHSLLRHDSGRGESLLLGAELAYLPSSKWRIALVGQNLLGATDYSAITYTDFGQLISRYPLRPRTIMVRTRFTF